MAYGRVAAVCNHIFDHWQEFDAWCCIKGVDPLELSTHRFYNLSMYYLTEGYQTEEDLAKFKDGLRKFDAIKSPIQTFVSRYRILARSKPTRRPVDKVPSGPKKYVPSWWRGDLQNFEMAKTVMKFLPK